jgi:pseudouridine synthase
MADSNSKTERLNKYLAAVGVASRRAIDVMIADGKISVNGSQAVLGQRITPGKDEILVGKKLITTQPAQVELSYYVLYKPAGVVSTVKDPEGRPTVMKYFSAFRTRLYPVGRLDQESEGLILMTNDGELAERLTHPKYHVSKTYLVMVSGEMTDRKLNSLRQGVKLKDGVTAPCEVDVTPLGTRRWSLLITLHEGKNRQIRRMLPHVELEVLKLKRIQFGPVSLGIMKPGEWRKLSTTELQLLKKQAGL